MSGDIYERLRERIGQGGFGFKKTTSGVELKLLRRLFSEEEAQMYLHLSWDLETPQQIAKRAMQDTERVAAVLKRMAEKGLVFPKRKGEMFYYAAAPFAHGILEHQVNRMDKELAQLVEDLSRAERVQEEPTAERQVLLGYPLRTVPVKVPIKVSQRVAPYEDISDIIKSQDRIAVAKCFCAVHRALVEPGCHQPLEVCLLMGFYAEYYVDNGWARWVTQEEALGILEQAEEAGLVHQPANSVDPGAICNCCPNCCLALRQLKMLPNPAAFVTSNYFSQVDSALCNGCEICVDRCPLDAISMAANDVADINLDRCIGCGLCVNICPTEAIMLVSKPEEARREPPFTHPFMRSSQDIESRIA